MVYIYIEVNNYNIDCPNQLRIIIIVNPLTWSMNKEVVHPLFHQVLSQIPLPGTALQHLLSISPKGKI